MENKSPLFAGFTQSDLALLMSGACVRRAEYDKGRVIFAAGDVISEIGVVERGSVNIESIDLLGGRSIFASVTVSGVFGEAYALCGEPMLTDAVAAERTDVLFVRYGALARENPALCGKLTANMLAISARKNIELSGRMLFTAPKTVRGRLLRYLSAMSAGRASPAGSGGRFTVPFDRRGLADYLGVDRSALSKELGKMQREGIVEFHKSEFRIVGGKIHNA